MCHFLLKQHIKLILVIINGKEQLSALYIDSYLFKLKRIDMH